MVPSFKMTVLCGPDQRTNVPLHPCLVAENFALQKVCSESTDYESHETAGSLQGLSWPYKSAEMSEGVQLKG